MRQRERWLRLLASAVAAAVCASGVLIAQPPAKTKEVRAMWVLRTSLTSRESIVSLVRHARENGFTPPRFRQQVDTERHWGGANYLFPDGHLESLPWKDVEERLTTSRSRFVHPDGASGAEYWRAAEQLIVAR